MTPALANITVNGKTVISGTPSDPIALLSGSTNIEVMVNANTGYGRRYYIRIIGSKDLMGLTLSAGPLSPTFNSDTVIYTASTYSTSTTITPTALTPTLSTITVNGTVVISGTASGSIALAFGANTITVVVTANYGNTKTYVVRITRGSTDLANLSISAGTLSPSFNSAIVNYTASTFSASTTITPTALTPTLSTITVNGIAVISGAASSPITLALGPNTITVVVTANDGTTITYQVTITRNLVGSTNLMDLTLSAGPVNPTFDSGTVGYTLSTVFISTKVTSTASTPLLSIITVNGTRISSSTPSGSIALTLGTNTISVVVTANDGNSKTYSIVVSRFVGEALNVTTGFGRSLILKTDGTLWASGYNGTGGLGDGTTTNRLTPVQIMTGVANVAAGKTKCDP